MTTDNNPFKQKRDFQEKVLQAMFEDRKWAASFIDIFNIDECLEFASHKMIANLFIQHYNKYKEIPQPDTMMKVLGTTLKLKDDEALRNQTTDLMMKIAKKECLSDLAWAKDEATIFCRKQIMRKALYEAANLIEDPEQYESIDSIVKKALSKGILMDTGLDYNEDIGARYSETYRRVVPTGIPELDNEIILNGGLGAGEIGVIVAASGVGKSHCLIHLGASALLAKKNVVYISFELNERMIGRRFDSHLVHIDALDLPGHQDKVAEFLQNNKHHLGRLRIAQMRGSVSTVNTIRAYLDKLETKNFKPDLLLIDYAGIMRSTEKFELERMERKKVMEELRDLGEELDIPVWTALQSNKEGAKSDFVDISNMAEAFGQSHPVDVALGLSRKPENKSTGIGNLFIAKNRAGRDGLKFDIMLDTAQSRLTVISPEQVAELQENAAALKDQLAAEKNALPKNLKKSLQTAGISSRSSYGSSPPGGTSLNVIP